jgi:hypothetical protein
LLFCLLIAQSAALGQWNCGTAASIDIPHEQSWLETMGPESWGHWSRFSLARPAIVEITGTPCSAPGSARVGLWFACADGTPEGLVGRFETPVFDLGLAASAEIALDPGEYFLEFKTLCVLDWDTWFWGTLQVRSRDTIDVKVLSNINPRSRGVVPVAILGSETLDVSDIDVTTLRFGPGEASPKHDLTNPWTLNEHRRDLDLDGRLDLVAHFPVRDAGFACTGGAIRFTAWATARLLDGEAIAGADIVRIVGCPVSRSFRRTPIFDFGS